MDARLTRRGAGGECGERGVEVVVLVLGQVQPLLLDVHQLALRPQVCNARGYQMSRKQDTICNRGLKIRDHNWPLTMHGLGRL